jgi:hypothetical protein
MKFECGDLERALAVPELMQEAREHLRLCAACRSELRLWNEISDAARELHEEWESPDLWNRIRTGMAAEPRPRHTWFTDWKLWAVAASVLVAVALGLWFNLARPVRPQTAEERQFLTDHALEQVEKSEAAYRHSIDDLYKLAEPALDKANSPLVAAYREKLILIDSAINDIRNNLQRNRFNASLQTELAALYREKQKTLEDVLKHDQKN